MSVSDHIRKLMGSESVDDQELAILLLESDSVPFEDKKEYIEKFLRENPTSFSEEQTRLLNAWLDLTRKNAGKIIENRIQKLNYIVWTLKNH